MTPNPFERVENRRIELLGLATEKERLLVKRIADLRIQAIDARAEADKAARNYHLARANALRADAMKIDDTMRTLNNVDLPKLRAEIQAIAGYRTPELTALWRAAETKAQNLRTDNTRSACDSLTEAKSALYGHLASLATADTTDFARAVVDAESAANVEHCEAGQNLLTLLGPKAAA